MAKRKRGAFEGFCERSIDGGGIPPAAVAAAMRGDFDNFAVASTPGGIERQEARGQAKAVADETLPIVMETWDALERLGFKKGKRQDELFQSCVFPAGWKKLPFPDDSRWNHIVDDKGRARGRFFYKAAFYDQTAFGRLESRYGVEVGYLKDGNKIVKAVDRSAKYNERTGRSKDRVLFKIKVEKDPDFKRVERQENLACLAAGVFLAERFPGWDDLTAYWD